MATPAVVLLMAFNHKSGEPKPVEVVGKLVVEIPIILQGILYTSKRWLFGISEPSSVSSGYYPKSSYPIVDKALTLSES